MRFGQRGIELECRVRMRAGERHHVVRRLQPPSVPRKVKNAELSVGQRELRIDRDRVLEALLLMIG